jgi:two-component system, NarL family, response regulator LiaR
MQGHTFHNQGQHNQGQHNQGQHNPVQQQPGIHQFIYTAEPRPTLPEKKILSRREIDVLLLVKDGFKNPDIASYLGLSTKTVENHVRNILLKLGVKNRTQAVVTALRSSMIPF